ncbi:hypothetical protein F5883DRAFT_226173 [Diaporthe sp. PMI_573]|nr:hypothetical protein F5883DRAFT_226173 [Diaporthaceae sp. PMI_573]
MSRAYVRPSPKSPPGAFPASRPERNKAAHSFMIYLLDRRSIRGLDRLSGVLPAFCLAFQRVSAHSTDLSTGPWSKSSGAGLLQPPLSETLMLGGRGGSCATDISRGGTTAAPFFFFFFFFNTGTQRIRWICQLQKVVENHNTRSSRVALSAP